MSLEPLASPADLEDRLGRDLTAAELGRADGVLRDVSANVRRFTGQDFTYAEEDTHRFKVRRNRVRLTQRPVLAVTAVVDLNSVAVSYEWDGFDVLDLSTSTLDWFEREPRRNGLTTVDVTYEHGYSTIPDDVVGVVCSIALRSLGHNPNETALQSETIEGYSYSLGSAAAAGGFGMLADERNTLLAYKRSVGFIDGGRLA